MYQRAPDLEVPSDLLVPGAMWRYEVSGLGVESWRLVVSGSGLTARSWFEQARPAHVSVWSGRGFWVRGEWMSVGEKIPHEALIRGISFETSAGTVQIRRVKGRVGMYRRHLVIELGDSHWTLSRYFLGARLRRESGQLLARFGWFRWRTRDDLEEVDQAVVLLLLAICTPVQVGGPIARALNHELPRKWPRPG